MLRFLLDEHLRGPLWFALLRHNASGGLPINVARVGDSQELPLGIDDPSILDWAERKVSWHPLSTSCWPSRTACRVNSGIAPSACYNPPLPHHPHRIPSFSHLNTRAT